MSVEAVAGRPVTVGRAAVREVRDEWRVVERWWTEAPIRRRYFELLLASGENAVVFEDEPTGAWFSQRA